MSKVKVLDKAFETSITEDEISNRIKELSKDINTAYADRNPLFLAILNGAFIFAADLYREITIPSEISFVKMASYEGTASTGVVNELIGLNQDISGRHIIIVEDIVDTGLTMKMMVDKLMASHPASVSICALLQKPSKLQTDIKVDYVAFEIPDRFVIGYGLVYDQQGRNLKEIFSII